MAVPIQIHPLTSFLGIEEGINSILLPEFYSPDGSDNTYVDQFGRIRKIKGYGQINTSVVTDTGGSTTAVRGLFPYTATEGGTTTRQLIGAFDDGTNEWELWYSTDAGINWTFIVDIGSGSINTIPDFAQYRDNLFITNGAMAPRKWTGSAISTAGGTQSPTVTGGVTGTGNLNGNYKWKLVSVEADGSRHPGSVASSMAQLQNEQGNLSWTADADTDVVGYELYRTTGTDEIYYFVTYIDTRTTAAYVDNIKDSTILSNRALSNHGEAPPSGAHFVEAHKDRMWYGRTSAHPLRVWISDVALPESVGVNSYLDFTDVDLGSDKLTGMKASYEGKMVVFTENSIWTVSGTGAVVNGVRDWYKRRSASREGTVSHRSVVTVPAGAVYRDATGRAQETQKPSLAFFSPHGDVRLFDGQIDIVVSESLGTIRGQLTQDQRHKVHALHDEKEGRIMWFYPFSPATEANLAMVWDYRRGSWHRWSSQNFSAAALLTSATVSQGLVVGSHAAGAIFDYFTGDSFNGTSITARWTTNTIYGRLGEDTFGREADLPDMARTKRFRWVDLLLLTDQDTVLTVGVLKAKQAITQTPFAVATITPDDTDRQSTQRKVLMKGTDGDYLHDTGFRITVTDSGQSGSWGIESIAYAYQTLPGTKRRT